MTPIRVVHLITDLDIGGAEMALSRLAIAADRRRFQMRVVSMMAPGPIGAQMAAEGIDVQTLGMKRGVPDPCALPRLISILQREPADLLQSWLYHADLLALVAARVAKVPRLVWNLRCSDMELSRYSHLSTGLRWVLARLSAQPDAVIVNSVAGKATHEGLGYRPRRWELVPNGIDIERFRPNPDARARFRAELGLPPESFVICLPARVDPMKDHATFLAAAEEFGADCSTACFLLVGRGTEAPNSELRPLLERTLLASRLISLGERNDMPVIFASADVVSLSSSFGEGFPNVVAEAMACGVPVVSTDVGDAARIVDTAGIIVPVRDSRAMAAAWRLLYNLGSAGRMAMGLTGRQRIEERFALPGTVARYEALYEELVGTVA